MLHGICKKDIQAKGWKGQEIDQILHGIEKPAITKGNLLTKSYESWKRSSQVKIILSNPPFGGQEEDEIENNFPKKFRTKETADLFFSFNYKNSKE